MPLTAKGKEILAEMKKQYGAERGEQIFYASKNKGTIKGVDTADAISLSGPQPQNNLNIPLWQISPAPGPPERPGQKSGESAPERPGQQSGKSPPERGPTATADALRKLNIANREFWSRKPR